MAERCAFIHGAQVRAWSRIAYTPCRPPPTPRGTGGVHPQRRHGRPLAALGGVVLAGVVMAAMDGLRLLVLRFLRAVPGSAPSWQDRPVRRRGGEHVGRLPRGVGRKMVGRRPAAPRGGNERWICRSRPAPKGVARVDLAEGHGVRHIHASPFGCAAATSTVRSRGCNQDLAAATFDALVSPVRTSCPTSSRGRHAASSKNGANTRGLKYPGKDRYGRFDSRVKDLKTSERAFGAARRPGHPSLEYCLLQGREIMR